MKILFCSPNVVSQELGASRVILGIANGLSRLGWNCRIIDPQETAREVGMSGAPLSEYPKILRAYLQRHAAEYDVVEFDNHYLPFPRSEFSPATLLVARSVLLTDHLLQVSLPALSKVKQKLKAWFSGANRRRIKLMHKWVDMGHVTVANADLVNVANTDDRLVLQASGVEVEKICVIPYGLSDEEFGACDKLNLTDEVDPRICFLGTFDERKGGADLITFIKLIAGEFPRCRFRLAGTAGLYQSREDVLSFFPPTVRSALEVIPHFPRADLLALLNGCTVGVFPSYAEGFGFGVLEMMAAGIPVIAYRAPGPPMMLDDEFLVPRGDVDALAEKIRALLLDENYRRTLACRSRRRAAEFTWEHAAQMTDIIYRKHTSRLASLSVGWKR